MNSTGIGNGVAVPHPRHPLEGIISQPYVSTIFPVSPVDFNAIDGQLVHVLFLVFSPSIRIHLEILSRLGFCLRNQELTTLIRNRPEKTLLFQYISQLESKLKSPGGVEIL
jgi:PTS system nitrogen regulatory IIA component